MSESIFDKHCEDYNKVLADSIGLSSDDKCSFFDNYKIQLIAEQFASERPYRILDFGCGIGKLSVLLAQRFAHAQVVGHDLSEKVLCYARKLHADIPNLAFEETVQDGQLFDIVVVSNVFHHVGVADRIGLLQSLSDRLTVDGALVVVEHNPYNPLTRYIVNRCPFDDDAVLIRRQEFIDSAMACGLNVRLKKYVLMFPWDISFLRRIESLFASMPFGAQYMLVLTRKGGG